MAFKISPTGCEIIESEFVDTVANTSGLVADESSPGVGLTVAGAVPRDHNCRGSAGGLPGLFDISFRPRFTSTFSSLQFPSVLSTSHPRTRSRKRLTGYYGYREAARSRDTIRIRSHFFNLADDSTAATIHYVPVQVILPLLNYFQRFGLKILSPHRDENGWRLCFRIMTELWKVENFFRIFPV